MADDGDEAELDALGTLWVRFGYVSIRSDIVPTLRKDRTDI